MSLEHLFAEKVETCVDFVFVIDATYGKTRLIKAIEEGTLFFYENLCNALAQRQKRLQKLRVKVTWFRDYYFDGQYAYGESKFFELPEENEDFRKYVASIRAVGGGDDPESALEALTLAMRSDFTQDGDRRKHIIVLFTDQSAHAFEDYDRLVKQASEYGYGPIIYPSDMPKSLMQLYDEWDGHGLNRPTKIDSRGKALILYAPDAYPWDDMEIDLDRLLRVSVSLGRNCEEFCWADFWELFKYPIV